jgi:2'-5' RNA ligase
VSDDIARAFIACRLPHAAEDALAARLRDVRRSLDSPVFAWVRRERWHVTLRFLGALRAHERESVNGVLATIARATAPIAAVLGEVRALPSWRTAHVVAYEVTSDGALEQVAREMNAGLDAAFGPPDKPFLAHLTVLRLRRAGADTIERARAAFVPAAAAEGTPFTLDAVTLYRSDLGREGPRYRALSTYPFAAPVRAT